MTLQEFLCRSGFSRVQLNRSGVGHFHTPGQLNGHPVEVLIDTGAASTVVGLNLARGLGLKASLLEMKGGGAGGANLEIFKLSDATLSIGDSPLQGLSLFAMDLSHVNQALQLKGVAPVHVILGADVLGPRAAVIDYGSSSLFLKQS